MTRTGRRSIRLKGYDYSQPGLYYITICTQHRLRIFGEIKNGEMVLNQFGEIAQEEWLKTAKIRENVELGEYVIMPNHIHGIISLIDTVGAHCNVPLRNMPPHNFPLQQTEQFGKSTKNSIPTIVKLYKSAVTTRINRLRRSPGASVWQRNYYEHIIRNEISHDKIIEYIRNNPVNWPDDKYYA